MANYVTAKELGEFESDRRCTCCDRDLTGMQIRMLELDQRTNTYHDRGDAPPDVSQGWFQFGLTCAKKMIAKRQRG